MRKPLALLFALLAAGTLSRAGELAARKDVFVFTRKPEVRVAGDSITISFAVKDHCDVTVAIENEQGEIVRHLASGVLGPNAPEPFRKNSLEQTLIWDSKDDHGRYVDDLAAHRVRASLGLRAQFHKTLFWSPKRRTRAPKYFRVFPVVAVAPEGVYVYDGGNGHHLRRFDHRGNYVRTVYPPPRDKLEAVKGLRWRTFPQDGKRLPLKWGLPQYTFLTSGHLQWAGDNWPTKVTGDAATTLALHPVDGGPTRIAVINRRLNRLTADGSTGGLPLAGPKTSITMYVHGVHGLRSGDYEIPPQSAAFSPDGKWLYLTGFRYHKSWRTGTVHAVYRIEYDSNEPMQLFKGSPYESRKDPSKPGTDNEHFNYPTSVDCDARGRVYVTDFLNDRLQVFAPDGEHLKTIPVHKPADVQINRETGQIYVFSYVVFTTHFWYHEKKLKAIKRTLKRFKSFDDPKQTGGWSLPKGTYGFPRGGGGLDEATIELDFHTEPLRMWVMRSHGPIIFELDGRQWKQAFDFASRANRKVKWNRGARHMKQRIYFNRRNKKLYVGDMHSPWPFHVTGFYRIPAVHTETGQVEIVDLPFDAEDMAMDMDGRAYLRTADGVARFDTITWREIPFDYGDRLKGMSAQGLRKARVASAIRFAGVLGVASGQLGGMDVSPKGHVVVTVANPAKKKSRQATKNMHSAGVQTYTPEIYPGRARPWEVHVFNKHGEVVYEDAVPSTGRMDGVLMDENDDLYVVVAGVGRVNGKKYFNPISCAVFKMKPGTKILSTRGALPLPPSRRPDRPPDVYGVDGAGDMWITDAAWVRGGVGFDGKRLGCHCMSQSRPALDLFARLFLPEIDHYSVLVVDTNGNEILRIGRYGNVDDGLPLDPRGGPPHPRPIGGDEVAIMHGQMLATWSDRRLFIDDLGNQRIVSVKLDYHESATVPLKTPAAE